MKTSSIAYSIVNLVGLSLISLVFIGIHQTRIREERFAADFGDGLIFISWVVPTAVVCLSVNLAWGGMAIADIVRRREKATLVAWSVCIALWGVLATLWLTHHIP
jgi:hypothetical protein